MITFENIMQYANIKNCAIEVHYPNSNIEVQKTFDKFIIGIELKDGIWFWFSNWIINISDFAETLSFEQRYNQHNGHIIRGRKTGWKVERTILTSLNQ